MYALRANIKDCVDSIKIDALRATISTQFAVKRYTNYGKRRICRSSPLELVFS